tara:strand:+ start:1397 stop:1807 length:411 start_codon:yes stop_codon:yes gene_type:complete
MRPILGRMLAAKRTELATLVLNSDNRSFQLDVNQAPNHSYGGVMGFHRALCRSKIVLAEDSDKLTFSYFSEFGKERHSGYLNVEFVYSLGDNNLLNIVQQPTLCNVTIYSHFDLVGAGNGDILDYVVIINVSRVQK